MSGALRYTLVVRHPETDAATALLAGQPAPEWAAGLVHDDDLVPDEGGQPQGYAGQKVDELKAEIARRNEGRDDGDLIPSDGKKADLVAALEADDAN